MLNDEVMFELTNREVEKKISYFAFSQNNHSSK